MRQSELTPSQHEELDALAAMSDEDIDTSDIPEIKEFSNPKTWAVLRFTQREGRAKAGGGAQR